MLLGGNWNNAANCGSRGRNANNVRSNTNDNISGRGAIRSNWIAQTPCAEIARTPAESLTLAECQNTKRRDIPFGSRKAKTGISIF